MIWKLIFLLSILVAVFADGSSYSGEDLDDLEPSAYGWGPHGFKLGHVKLGHVGRMHYGSIGGIKAGRIGGLKYGGLGKIYGSSLLGAANPNEHAEDSDVDSGHTAFYSNNDIDNQVVGMEHQSSMHDNQQKQQQMIGAAGPSSMQRQRHEMMIQPQMNDQHLMAMSHAHNEGQLMGHNMIYTADGQMLGANGPKAMPMHEQMSMSGMGQTNMYANEAQMLGADGPKTMPMHEQMSMRGMEQATMYADHGQMFGTDGPNSLQMSRQNLGYMSPYEMYAGKEQMLGEASPMTDHDNMMQHYESNIKPRSASAYHMMRSDSTPMETPMTHQYMDTVHMMMQQQRTPAMYEQHDHMVGAQTPDQTNQQLNLNENSAMSKSWFSDGVDSVISTVKSAFDQDRARRMG